MSGAFGTTGENIITIHGKDHVVVVNGYVFQLPEELFDPTVQRIEWAAGQGMIYWNAPNREPSSFGAEGYEWHIVPFLDACGKERSRLESGWADVQILEKEQEHGYATGCQRHQLLKDIREIEEKLIRSTQAVLAAQLAGKEPAPEDVQHFLSLYAKKVEKRAQLSSLESGVIV